MAYTVGEFCGLSRKTGTMILERDVAFECLAFFIFFAHRKKPPPLYQGGGKLVREPIWKI